MNLKKQLPRGIRNNNPLNIRIGNDWYGEVSKPTDGTFEQFEEMQYGCRAAFIILHNYMYRHNLKTIPQIIERWAPKSENDTQKYVETVVKVSGIEPTKTLSFFKKEDMIRLFKGMCFAENSVVIEDSAIEKGYDMAFGRNYTI